LKGRERRGEGIWRRKPGERVRGETGMGTYILKVERKLTIEENDRRKIEFFQVL